ncbi:MAG: HAMP domain-containing histidine kinase [Bacilli bacterium]|nr:HAMP domain-containing histidine kinase [Bacilli bacterium]
MIEKLRKKISLIILIAISIPLLFIIIFYNISYYNNIIRANTKFVDRFIGEPNGGPVDRRENKIESSEINGIYSISINNGNIYKSSSNVTDKIKKYALKTINKKNENGIIGNYIYKKIIHDKDIAIILIESSSEINKIKMVIISSIIVLVIGITIFYIISKKIAELIVKPVEETFTKQIDFISDASHELKTPLAVIRANADVLEGEIGKNKWLSYIQNETDNMTKLISELLLLTKIENIDKLRKPERFNISDHIELTVSSFESIAFEKKIKIETKIQKDIIVNKFNKDDITHILSTLIDNAIKHTDEKKKVIVELEKNKDKIIIDVKNKGIEIPISEREKIFDRFYRIDKSRNRNEKRYGLGLSIAKAITLKNSGTIDVDYKDGYTIFRVELPL